MIGNDILQGLVEHNTFIFFNTYIHIIVGIVLATALYPFLSKKGRERWTYFTIVFFPLIFGSIFPDLMFILSSLVESRSLNSLFFVLTSGGAVHSTFHFHFPLVLVAPVTLCLVMLMNKWITKKYFDHMPRWSFILVCGLAIGGAVMHVYMDTLGF